MSTALEIIETIPPFRDSRSDSNKFPQTVYGGRSMANASSQNRSNAQNQGMVMSGTYTSASSNAEEYSSSSQAYPLVISQGDVSSRGTRSTVEARNDTGSGFRNTISSSLLRASEKTASTWTASSDDGSQDIMIEEKRRCPDGDGHTIHQYLRGRMLGKGGFAKVYLCTAMDTGKQYAVKVVAKSNLVKARARQKVCFGIFILQFLGSTTLTRLLFSSYKQRSKFIAPSNIDTFVNTSTTLRTAVTVTFCWSFATTKV
jgi:hypothetical protein